MRIWSRLGVSAGILGLAYIVLAESIKRTESDRWPFWLGGWCLVMTGIVLGALCLGIHRDELSAIRKIMFPARTEGAPVEEEIPTRALNRLHGALLILATGSMMLILFPPIRALDARAPIPPATGTGRSVPRTVSFPELEVQGIVVKSSGNSVLINRRTYFEGDTVRGAKILLITPTNIVIELEGQTKVLPLTAF